MPAPLDSLELLRETIEQIVGSHTWRALHLGKRAGDKSDGRDRKGVGVIGDYPKGDKEARGNAEQKGMNDRGGVKEVDNKRNEVAPKNWSDRGIKPPSEE